MQPLFAHSPHFPFVPAHLPLYGVLALLIALVGAEPRQQILPARVTGFPVVDLTRIANAPTAAALGLRMAGPLQKPVRLQQLMDAMQGREAQDAGCIGF